jgi:hypothetical protein
MKFLFQHKLGGYLLSSPSRNTHLLRDQVSARPKYFVETVLHVFHQARVNQNSPSFVYILVQIYGLYALCLN